MDSPQPMARLSSYDYNDKTFSQYDLPALPLIDALKVASILVKVHIGMVIAVSDEQGAIISIKVGAGAFKLGFKKYQVTVLDQFNGFKNTLEVLATSEEQANEWSKGPSNRGRSVLYWLTKEISNV